MGYDRARRQGEDVIGWAIETQRLDAAGADNWRKMLSRGTVNAAFIERLASPLPAEPGSLRARSELRAAVRQRLGLPVAASQAEVAAAVEKTLAASPGTPAPRQAAKPAPMAAANTARPLRVAGADPAWYAANPALDEVRQTQASVFAAAVRLNPQPPTLFESGDLPPFCASGIDPALLADVPWMARHRIAATADRAEALRMIEDVSGEHGLDIAASEYGRDLANKQYQSRVERWAVNGAMVADEQRAIAAQSRQVAAAGGRPVKATAEMTDDEIEEAVFGELDRQRAQQAQDYEDMVARGTVVGQFRGARLAPGRRTVQAGS